MGYMGTSMLTNGEHDSLWRNVFKNQIPNATGYLEQLVVAEKVRNQLTAMQFAYEHAEELGSDKAEIIEIFKSFTSVNLEWKWDDNK